VDLSLDEFDKRRVPGEGRSAPIERREDAAMLVGEGDEIGIGDMAMPDDGAIGPNCLTQRQGCGPESVARQGRDLAQQG